MESIFMGLPLWAVMVAIVGGMTVVAVGGQALIRRIFPGLRARRHNDVAGFLVAVIGVIYAVTVGFIIAEQWENFTDARARCAQEAHNLSAIAEGSAVLGPVVRSQVEQAVVAYNRAVVQWWPRQQQEARRAEARQEQTLAPLYEVIDQVDPATPAQQAFVAQATEMLAQVTADREARLHQAGTAHLEGPLWAVVGFASMVTVVFCMLFGLESPWLHYTMIAGVAMAVAGNLMLVVLLNHPLSGPLQVSPDVYQAVVRDLSR